MFNIETMHGNIHYGENIIRTIVEKGIDKYEGKVLLYKFSKKLPGFVPVDGRVVMLSTGGANTVRVVGNDDEGYEIEVFVVVRFGTSIKEVTNGLIDYIYEHVEKITQTRPDKVTISVTAVLSKNMVRRDIEVSK